MKKFICNSKNEICPKCCYACVDGYVIEQNEFDQWVENKYIDQECENRPPYPIPKDFNPSLDE